MPDDHRGLLGEPPTQVDVVVRNPPPGALTVRIVALRRCLTVTRLLALSPVVVAIAVAVAIATGGRGSGVAGAAPMGGAIRCINASTLCMIRGSSTHQTTRGGP